MSNIVKIDNYRVSCEKPYWTDEDVLNASCLGIVFNEERGSYIIDVRTVSKKATMFFLRSAFPAIIESPSYEVYRKKIFADFKSMYQQVFDDYMMYYHPKTKYTRDLFLHQKETLAHSINKQHNLWALDMGLGKTITSATMSKITECRRTIIISPTLVKWNWFEDMTRFWGYNPMYWTILDANKSKCIKAFEERFVVLNFEMVSKFRDYLLRDEINHIIIDECHYIKNITSQRGKAVLDLISHAPKSRLTMLSGTPITNRINDMFSYLKLSHHPLGESKTKFEEKYTIKVGRSKVVGAKNLSDLRGKTSNLMIRLKSEDCIDLPPMIITNYFFEHNELNEEYQLELEQLREKKLKYDSLHGSEKTKMNNEIKNNIHTLNRLAATSKVNQVKLLIDSLVEEGEKVIVFSGYKDPINNLEKIYGNKCVKIDGSVNPHKRQELINRFRQKDDCNIFLANMKAGGIGINLVEARWIINMNFPFTPEQIEQAQKRAHRPGQKRTVYVANTIAKGTIDEHIFELLSNKAEDINELIDDGNKAVIRYGNLPGELFKKLLEN